MVPWPFNPGLAFDFLLGLAGFASHRVALPIASLSIEQATHLFQNWSVL